MDRVTFEDYLTRHNAGDYRGLAETYFHAEIDIEVSGGVVAHGRDAALTWLATAATQVASTLFAYDLEFDPNGLEVWADLYEWAESRDAGESPFTGPMHPGQIRLTPLRAHYILRGGRFGCIVVERADGPVEIDKPDPTGRENTSVTAPGSARRWSSARNTARTEP
ncbi:hypothetical protein NDR87_04295 [Nocardia sp. CDC159]|uniref:SnoaL-like domain-containing protein n=1 Tax=Nocardia pulmonis TaxID=2951408 RepID=A0A9X2E4W2_9NOCA|nr:MULTISPECIES: hypothetical protein [Nocardia]MCM6773118.1 hypothetical protein [Nocardia pulmonis]MCM6785579.1 hypothetical protein [Nocardia sp. CDC159]